MTAFRAEHLAKEAKRLKHDDVLNEALRQMRMDALEQLAVADPMDSRAVIYSQVYAALCNEFTEKLGEFILNAPAEDDHPV